VATIALDPTYRDWSLVNGRLVLVTGATECAQKLAARLVWFRNAWFRDRSQGMPYWEQILGKARDIPSISQIFRSVILSTPGVKSIATMTLQFQRAQRRLDYVFEVVHDSGAVITGGRGVPFLVDGKAVSVANTPEAA